MCHVAARADPEVQFVCFVRVRLEIADLGPSGPLPPKRPRDRAGGGLWGGRGASWTPQVGDFRPDFLKILDCGALGRVPAKRFAGGFGGIRGPADPGVMAGRL